MMLLIARCWDNLIGLIVLPSMDTLCGYIMNLILKNACERMLVGVKFHTKYVVGLVLLIL